MASGKFVKAMSITALAVMVVGLVGASTAGELTDSRDGKKYKTVKIGNQTWMADNLNYQPSSGKSWCYENNNSNCSKYGRLYDWETAKTSCPSGWHLPSNAEWTTLVNYVGGWSTAGTKLKSTSGWASSSGIPAGTDDYGFSALPGGNRDYDGSFSNAGSYGDWWTATERNSGYAYSRDVGYDVESVSEGIYDKSLGFSVRCLQD
jgi:uncharacterized protein (TIGR02145 family)